MPNTPQIVRGDSRSFIFAANTAVGLRCTVNASGEAVICSAQQKSVGISDNGYAIGEAGSLLLHHMTGTTFMKATEAIPINGRVYAAANGEVAASGSVLEGIALSAATNAGDLIEVLVLNAPTVLESVTAAASAAVTNTNAETSFAQTLVLAAGTLKVGDVIEVEAQGIATATNSTDTLNVKLYIGATEVAATGALDVANDNIFSIRMRLVIRTVGVGGTFVATGTTSIGASGTITEKAVYKASTAIDTTIAQTLDVKATWSVANAGNSVRMDVFRVRRVFGAAA